MTQALNVQGVLLAAGFGRRFVQSQAQEAGAREQDKLLASLSGQQTNLLSQTAQTLINVLPSSLAVIQPDQQARKAVLQQLGLQVVESKAAVNGMGHAINAAVGANPEADGWLIALADMPWVETALMQALLRAFKTVDQIVVPVYQGRRGHPVLFGARWQSALSQCAGDQGAKAIIQQNAAAVTTVDWHSPSILADVDVVADLDHKC